MTTQKQITIVEDDSFVARIFQNKFEQAGYKITVTNNGQDALKSMTTQPPDLIFLDLSLPNLSGVEILRFIRKTERTKKIPVFILTNSQSLSPEVQSAWQNGANMFFNKSFSDLNNVVNIVSEHFGLVSEKPIISNPASPGNSDGATILVVDDDPMIHRVLKFFLTQVGYKVLQAYNGKDALALAEESYPDLMILDRAMPEMDGLEVMTNWRSNPKLSNIPVIMLSSTKKLPQYENALPAGIVEYVQKPFSTDELLAHIRKSLSQPVAA